MLETLLPPTGEVDERCVYADSLEFPEEDIIREAAFPISAIGGAELIIEEPADLASAF